MARSNTLWQKDIHDDIVVLTKPVLSVSSFIPSRAGSSYHDVTAAEEEAFGITIFDDKLLYRTVEAPVQPVQGSRDPGGCGCDAVNWQRRYCTIFTARAASNAAVIANYTGIAPTPSKRYHFTCF